VQERGGKKVGRRLESWGKPVSFLKRGGSNNKWGSGRGQQNYLGRNGINQGKEKTQTFGNRLAGGGGPTENKDDFKTQET